MGDFGFTELGLKIIAGDFECPEDMKESTFWLLKATGQIGKDHMHDDLNMDMTPDDFNTVWGRAKEHMASSLSQQHFGHYIAMAKSKLLSKGMAMKITLHLR